MMKVGPEGENKGHARHSKHERKGYGAANVKINGLSEGFLIYEPLSAKLHKEVKRLRVAHGAGIGCFVHGAPH